MFESDLSSMANPIIGIIGESRPDLDRVAIAVAERLDPGFSWLHVLASGRRPLRSEFTTLEQIGPDRVQLVEACDLRPANAGSNLSFFVGGVGSDAASSLETRQRRLPEVLWELLTRPGTGSGTHAVVLANFDIAIDLIPPAPEFLATVAGELRRLGMVAIFTLARVPEGLRSAFDDVIDIGAGPSPNAGDPEVTWTGSSTSWLGQVFGDGGIRSTSDLLARLRPPTRPAPSEPVGSGPVRSIGQSATHDPVRIRTPPPAHWLLESYQVGQVRPLREALEAL
jgi:hypothetical protein